MAQAARTFRIFVSSTFSDLEPERNALQRKVFPALRKLCEEGGARFQAIDLRWGVPDEAGLDQRTIRICLEEVERCRAISPRPNFLVLLGERYGWRPLPPEIPADEYDEIAGRLRSDPAGLALLEAWYRFDGNAIPAARSDGRARRRADGVWVLQPRTGRYTAYGVWDADVERPLRQALAGAVAGMDLPREDRLKYEASATEQEIERGALKTEDAPGHVFCFFRTIGGLPHDRRADGWIDMLPGGRHDTEVSARLEALKERLGKRLPGNVRFYPARWVRDPNLTEPPRREEPAPVSDGHLDALCEDVQAALGNVITAELARLEAVEPLEKEIAEHERFLEGRTRVFNGREATLGTIAQYLRSSGGAPLGVHGDSGSGKSALMARAVQRARADLPGAQIVVRFIGWTPRSTDIRSLLDGLCRQISRAYGADEGTIPRDYQELVQELPRRLGLATAERPLLVFLDALDQLADQDGARRLGWLPAKLPEHVRLIVSTTPGETLSVLERRLPADRRVVIEEFRRGEAEETLRTWLAEAGRRITAPQRDLVLERFAACPQPLYLRLVFAEACRWPSWREPGAITLAGDIAGVIRQLFARLSATTEHGPVLTRRALAYLGAARNGLGEDELLDVLSLDRVVLRDFIRRARHQPPEPRLPVAVWARLAADLDPYLTERYADGVNLLTFYHKQLLEVIREDFVAGREGEKRHWLLSRYFRRQPLFARGTEVGNLRKLSELPHQLTMAAQWGPLLEVLSDLEFLEAKCTWVGVTTEGTGEGARTVYEGVYELQEDFRFALERMPPDA
ncbi:MAG: AAA family ATPase [Gemmatimonadales bacterium]